MAKLLNSNFLELPPMSFALFYLCVLITFVTSSDDIKEFHSKTDFGAKSTSNDVADALFQIAQILRSNQNHSSLYERLALLEARITMSQNHNVLAELRIKELENKVLAMNHKLNASSEVLAKAEALEINTKKLMENFEEKLSTLATEILRLKSIAVNIEKSLTPSVGQESNFLQEDPREVESNKKAISYTSTEEKNHIEHLKSKSKFPGLREICSLSTSSSLSDFEAQKCWFTLDGKLSNWTTADRFCRFADGKLVTDINNGFHIANLTKENDQIFWMSKSTLTTLFEDETSTKSQINLEENSKSNFPLTDIGRGDQDAGDHVVDLRKHYKENKSSGAIDIRSLPNLDERNGNIEKNFYISNVRISHDDGFLSAVDALSVKQVSKRSPDDFVSLAKPKDAVKFSEFLLLENSDEPQEDSFEQQKITSDLNPKLPTDLLSLLRGMSSDADTNEIKTVDETKNCPMMVCSKDADCVIRVDDCSNLRSFWCQR